MVEEKKIIKLPHNVIIENRKNVMITGVNDIDSFDENVIVLFTEQGEMTIRGVNLHINKLSVDTGELTVEGLVSSIHYTDDHPSSGGFFGRLFK